LIDFEALPYWFMDDGGLGGNSKYGLVIDVSSFSTKEKEWIQALPFRRFDLVTSLHTSKSSTKLFDEEVLSGMTP